MKKSLLFCCICAVITVTICMAFNIKGTLTVRHKKAWFPHFDFNAAVFKEAPREFGPLTRWWWPGNDVNNQELQREVRMFADNGFAGVEVQPIANGLSPKMPAEQSDRVYSWDTPSFYEHLRAVMEQAQKSNIIVDMNGGSGWPLGGAFIGPDESMRTLAISDTVIEAGAVFNDQLPAPHNHDMKAGGMMDALLRGNVIDNKWARIKSVVAVRSIGMHGTQTILDPKTIIDLTKKVNGKKLSWQAPADGKWRLIVSWDILTGEKPSCIASNKTSYVIDHMDPLLVKKAYDHLLVSETGLPAYYGNPLRAVFNDSYEFHVDRIISPDFLDVFQKMNGYNIAPYLASVFQKGYDHPAYLAAAYFGAKPAFMFNENENWRMMYDYDRTVSRVFQDNFIKTSNRWMGAHGLLHRTQAYGFPGDLIGNAGAADIPEAEQLFAEGSEGYLKLITSGAHLNHRPVISQESFVSIYRAEMTTPQKIRVWADKSFACGINQLIYHGSPYKYNNGEFGKEGWNTFSSPYMPFVNFSNGMNESDNFWKDIKAVNQYLTRCQYALRSGRPKTDVLIYMPFVDLTEDQIPVNPEEILNKGYFKGVEPDIKGFGIYDGPKSLINVWYTKLWKTVNELEAKGISWEFVNDERLQKATWQSGRINIAGNQYQALILANLPYVDLGTAKHINTLSKKGLRLWSVGELPRRQPSFLNYEANDRLTKELIAEAISQKNSKQINGQLPLQTIHQTIKFSQPVTFSRGITRQMSDGSQLKFILNKTDQWQTIGLTVDKSFDNTYWLNPVNGAIEKDNGNTGSYQLPPYGSIFFYAAAKSIPSKLITPVILSSYKAADIVKIDNWKINVGDEELENSALLDWRSNDRLKYKSDSGLYTSTFNLDKVMPGKHYFVDLGQVFYVADVKINGKSAGNLLFSPYSLDITNFIKKGRNAIEVTITTNRRNKFVGNGANGDPFYKQFKGKEKTLVPSGLVGPVIIKSL
ncbi:glycosyl hydrolase [Mucilaginibacter sp. cycad4]|uniref:glycosyl hydrolase n=1 Tax=Mucilaginibacter sp. cycad4 TaxID=3342096 RepID=UPI002AAAE0DE|nr:glycosyl hydrolase [Mucilaginibacter gossypii]WPV01965.1 glycosyl hydrolase [Mucilaginibacter gossypii]